jgi:GH15 family glucan-1,4-alpha-glucosidase
MVELLLAVEGGTTVHQSEIGSCSCKQCVEVFIMVRAQELDRFYLPVTGYELIGDCHSAMLVAPDGSIEWGSLPDLDSPALFSRLKDAEYGGFFRVAPADPTAICSQRYLRGSNILQTFFSGLSGEVVLTDFMPVESLSARSCSTLNKNTRGDRDGTRRCLVRMMTCTQGTMEIAITLKATPGAAADACSITLLQKHTAAVVAGREEHIGLAMIGAILLPSFSVHILNDGPGTHPALRIQATLCEGERLTLALGLSRSQHAARHLALHDLPSRNFEAELSHTLHCWRNWLADCRYSGPYQEWIQRSALTLKLLGMEMIY